MCTYSVLDVLLELFVEHKTGKEAERSMRLVLPAQQSTTVESVELFLF